MQIFLQIYKEHFWMKILRHHIFIFSNSSKFQPGIRISNILYGWSFEYRSTWKCHENKIVKTENLSTRLLISFQNYVNMLYRTRKYLFFNLMDPNHWLQPSFSSCPSIIQNYNMYCFNNAFVVGIMWLN
jgi:hypothetical protein